MPKPFVIAELGFNVKCDLKIKAFLALGNTFRLESQKYGNIGRPGIGLPYLARAARNPVTKKRFNFDNF